MELNETRPRARWVPIIFLIILALLLFVLDETNNLDGAMGIVRDPLTGALAFTSVQTDKVADALSGPRDVREAQGQIELLQERINALERELEELSGIEGEYQQLLELFDQTRDTPGLERVVANVIARDTSPSFRSIIIDKGSDDGVLVGMPVEGSRGLVGQIFRSTGNMAQVILVTDNTSSVPARLTNSRATGILQGGGTGDELTMDWVDLEVQVVPGEIVITSGLGGQVPGGADISRFPADLIIGRVIEVQRSEAELFQRAVVQPVTDFESLEIVSVITNAPSPDTTIFDEIPGE